MPCPVKKASDPQERRVTPWSTGGGGHGDGGFRLDRCHSS